MKGGKNDESDGGESGGRRANKEGGMAESRPAEPAEMERFVKDIFYERSKKEKKGN